MFWIKKCKFSVCVCFKTGSGLLCLCVWAEVLNKDVLKDYLEGYGKVVDQKKEDMRSGMSHHEFRLAIIKEYNLLITPEQFTEEIRPMYRERWVFISLLAPASIFGLCLKYWSDFSCYLLLPSRWLLARALPGANRLIKHLHNQKVPFALASNSLTKNVEAKVSHQPG